MKNFTLIFIMSFLKMTWAQAPTNQNSWVVWNVGQGLWVTHILPFTCTHYDFGGEIGSFKRLRQTLLKQCAYKQNRLNLSHWHADHFIQFNYIIKVLPKVCWESQPLYRPKTSLTEKIRTIHLPSCSATENSNVQSWTPLNYKSMNDSSSVFLDQNVLLPGDSSTAQEKNWSQILNKINQTEVLILGHHGSRTSTGVSLLSQLPKLKFSISSARIQRYGHPHKLTLRRLKRDLIPVLRTEDWGNIWFSL